MRTQLTDLAVQKLPEGTYSDTKLSGFGIRIGKTRKVWFCIETKTRKRIGLGHYPAVSLSEARKKAHSTLGGSHAKTSQISFSDAKEAFLALPRWRPQSKRVLTSNLRKFTWKRSLDKITHEDVAAALDAIESPSARAHALKDIRTFFNWCVPRYLPASPCVGLRMDAQPSRDRTLSNTELQKVWKACDYVSSTFATIIKLLILTGQRKNEIGSLQFEQISLGENLCITIPPAIAKNGREHTFPIGPLTHSLLPTKTTGYLFRSAKNPEDPYNGYTFHLKQLQKLSQTSNWTLHDLRRTFVSNMASLGVAPHIISALINHVSEGLSPIQRVYNKYNYFNEMREAVDKYQHFLKTLVE